MYLVYPYTTYAYIIITRNREIGDGKANCQGFAVCMHAVREDLVLEWITEQNVEDPLTRPNTLKTQDSRPPQDPLKTP